MPLIHFVRLGLTEYGSCWDLQLNSLALRQAGQLPDTLLLTEHTHVYTIGRNGDTNHLLADDDELGEKGIAVYHNDRGGGITYHGPGQFIAYPILDLRSYSCDLHRYLRDLEEVVIRTLAAFGVQGSRVGGYTGVWVGDEKICAIGIKSSRWVTMHGLALNVNTDLSYFGRIIPCGIFERGVTSLQQVLGRRVDMGEVSARAVCEFADVFHAEMREASSAEFGQTLAGKQGIYDQSVARPC